MPRRPAYCLLALVLGAIACQPVDGLIFADASGGSSDTDVGPCEPGTLEFAGNHPNFSHDCGESCDSDWCSCEPCVAATGPLQPLTAGDHVLRLVGGVSGVGDYQLTLQLDDGTTLLDLALTREGLFDDEFPFTVPPGCHNVLFTWDQQSGVCSRLYEIFIDYDVE
ncbi:MAG: hypothetical protein AAF721_13760 [Myxococcota bacterium]